MSDRRRTSRYLKGKQTDKEFSRHLGQFLVQLYTLLNQKMFQQGQWNFANNKLLDVTDNANDFTLGKSYCVNNNARVGGFPLKSNITVDFTAPFAIEFEYYKSSAIAPGIIIGGDIVTTHINITDTTIMITSAGTAKTFNVTGTVGVWNRITIVGDGTNIRVTNITDSSTHQLGRGTITSFIVAILLGRVSASAHMNMPVRQIKVNSTNEWRFSEYPTNTTYAPFYYDRIGGNHATGHAYATITKLDNTYHSNLRNGYSIWENGAGGVIWVPYGSDGNPLTLTAGTDTPAGYAKTYDCPAHISKHNGCETGIYAPIALLPYDVANYMFTASVSNELTYQTMSENRGNKIFCNKSTVNYFSDLTIYKRAV